MADEPVMSRVSITEMDAIIGKKFPVLNDGHVILVDYMGDGARRLRDEARQKKTKEKFLELVVKFNAIESCCDFDILPGLKAGVSAQSIG